MDLGYGLAKMGEGLSAGYLKGTLYNDEKATKESQLQRKYDYQNKRLDQTNTFNNAKLAQGDTKNTIAQDKVTNDKKIADDKLKYQNYGNGLKAIADLAPHVDEATIKTIVAPFFGDSAESKAALNSMKITGDKITIDTGDGTMLITSQDLPGLSTALTNDGENGLKTYVQTHPGSFIPKQSAPESTHDQKTREEQIRHNKSMEGIGWKKLDAGQKTAKVSEYATGINTIAKKYQIDPGITVNAEGTIDTAALLAGKTTFYDAMKKKADTGDKAAAADLQTVDKYYKGIDAAISAKSPSLAVVGESPVLPPAPTPKEAPVAASKAKVTPAYEAEVKKKLANEKPGTFKIDGKKAEWDGKNIKWLDK